MPPHAGRLTRGHGCWLAQAQWQTHDLRCLLVLHWVETQERQGQLWGEKLRFCDRGRPRERLESARKNSNLSRCAPDYEGYLQEELRFDHGVLPRIHRTLRRHQFQVSEQMAQQYEGNWLRKTKTESSCLRKQKESEWGVRRLDRIRAPKEAVWLWGSNWLISRLSTPRQQYF